MSPSAPETSSAFTSMCDASTGASSSRNRVRIAHRPRGRESASASSTAASGCGSGATANSRVATDDAGAMRETEPGRRRLLWRRIPGHALQLGTVNLKVRPRDQGSTSDHLRQLVGPASVPEPNLSIRHSTSLLGPDEGCRQTRRAARLRSSPRRGRSPGRGCRRSRRPVSGTPSAPRAPSHASFREARATFSPSAS